MKVTINGTVMEIFSGARVADAIRQYYTSQKKIFPSCHLTVEDLYGNRVALDGRLTENSHFLLKQPDNE